MRISGILIDHVKVSKVFLAALNSLIKKGLITNEEVQSAINASVTEVPPASGVQPTGAGANESSVGDSGLKLCREAGNDPDLSSSNLPTGDATRVQSTIVGSVA